jgi:hypothetical protein
VCSVRPERNAELTRCDFTGSWSASALVDETMRKDEKVASDQYFARSGLANSEHRGQRTPGLRLSSLSVEID